MTDKMALNPLDLGNGPMMSNDMDSHGDSGGVWGLSGVAFFCLDALFCWQVEHPLTYVLTSLS